jgi:anti-sigma B factor antagonist
MFDIKLCESGEVVLSGRFDAAQVEKAKAVFDRLTVTTSVDFKDLIYVSSAGLGVLMATQKRLSEKGQKLKLKNVTGHIRDIFRIARFDLIFEIE